MSKQLLNVGVNNLLIQRGYVAHLNMVWPDPEVGSKASESNASPIQMSSKPPPPAAHVLRVFFFWIFIIK